MYIFLLIWKMADIDTYNTTDSVDSTEISIAVIGHRFAGKTTFINMLLSITDETSNSSNTANVYRSANFKKTKEVLPEFKSVISSYSDCEVITKVIFPSDIVIHNKAYLSIYDVPDLKITSYIDYDVVILVVDANEPESIRKDTIEKMMSDIEYNKKVKGIDTKLIFVLNKCDDMIKEDDVLQLEPEHKKTYLNE